MVVAQTLAGCCWLGGQDTEEAGLRMSPGDREDSQSWSQSALVSPGLSVSPSVTPAEACESPDQSREQSIVSGDWRGPGVMTAVG